MKLNSNARKPSVQIGSTLLAISFATSFAAAQQIVNSRSDAGTNQWWNESQLPWFYTIFGEQDRPDNFTRNVVFINHNNNTTMSVNNFMFDLGSLNIESGATSDRTYNAVDGGGISLTAGYFNDSNANQTFNVPISIDGANVMFSSSISIDTFTDDFLLNNNNATMTGEGITILSGTVSGTGGSIVQNGDGMLRLLGDNSFSGGVTLTAGILNIGHNGALGTGTFTINGGRVNAAGIEAGGTITTDNALNLAGNLVFTGSNDLNFGTGAVTLQGGNRTVQVDAGTLTFGAAVGQDSDARELTKSGEGTLVLGGDNTYLGDTLVNAGTLIINGSTTSSSAVIINSGATLKGTGSIGGTVTIHDGGTLASGTSIQSLTTGTLNLNSGSVFEYEIDRDAAPGMAGDLTGVTVDLNIASGAILTITDLGAMGSWNVGDKLTLISYAGEWNGGLFTYDGQTLNHGDTLELSGATWQFSYNDSVAGSNFTEDLTGDSFVTMTVIPEPHTVLLGGIGILMILRRRR